MTRYIALNFVINFILYLLCEQILEFFIKTKEL